MIYFTFLKKNTSFHNNSQNIIIKYPKFNQNEAYYHKTLFISNFLKDYEKIFVFI